MLLQKKKPKINNYYEKLKFMVKQVKEKQCK